jgi:ectoine hydroxylase-related dioxygenase (phytanoyl-CoA dioxygenase family)
MHTTLSQEQIDQYQTDGALVYRNFLSEEEVDSLLGNITRAVQEMGDTKAASNSEFARKTDKKQSTEEQYYEDVFLQRLNLWTINEAVRNLFLGPELGQMVCRLAGVDGMRVWHDQTLQKMPWGNPTAWHLDNPFWSFYSRNSISIWIALDDATVENGCMYYLPGTHKQAEFERSVPIGASMGKLFKAYPEWKEIKPIVGTMKRGDCGFHNGLTAHGAGANMTPGYRRAMTCAYMPEGSTFNGQKNILPDDYFNSLNRGDVLENDELNPRVWPR